MSKYDTFFEEIKSFAIDVKIATIEDFIGAQKNEILDLETKINYEFKTGMRSYLNHFGHKIGIWNFDLTKFTIKNILNAERNAQEDKIRNSIISGKLVDHWSGEKISKGFNNKICFVNFFETNYYFTFINGDNDDTKLFGWDGEDESHQHSFTITSSLRWSIFSGLKSLCDVRRKLQNDTLPKYRIDWHERTKKIEIENLNWLNLFKEKYISNNLLISGGQEFELVIRKIEKEENRIIGVKEYGERFEEFIKKKAA